jgi:TolB-like protein
VERPVAWTIAACALAGRAALAATPTVAVLPFVDLSGGARGPVGEAIRETVTTDLRGVAGLRVVERDRIDAVLREQRVAARADLDVPRAAELGKLVGASLIATGAYQRAGGSVRITARFVDVATGVIVGSAKVDGAAGDFLALQDRVTGELARSAGLAWAPRRRPKLRSLRAVETYGEAVVERDEAKRRALLQAAVDEEPEFEYAARDLSALRERVEGYAARAEREQEKVGLQRVEQLAARARAARAPAEVVATWGALFDELHAQLRFRRVAEEARALLAHPPLAASTALGARLDERVRFEEIFGLSVLKRDTDRLLAEGERFLSSYPTSRHFSDVQRLVEYAIRWKRQAELGPAQADARIAALPPERRDDPCLVGHIYHEERVLRRAAEGYERCVHARPADQSALFNLMNVYISLPDFAAARRTLALVRERFPGVAEQPAHQGWRELPIDAD